MKQTSILVVSLVSAVLMFAVFIGFGIFLEQTTFTNEEVWLMAAQASTFTFLGFELLLNMCKLIEIAEEFAKRRGYRNTKFTLFKPKQ